MSWNTATVLHALRGEDLLELGMSANQVRDNLHPEDVVTYELRGPVASLEEAVEDALLHGSGNVTLANVRDTEHAPLAALETRMQAQRERLPRVTFHRLPISRLRAIAVDEQFQTLRRLHESGLRSLDVSFDPTQPSAVPLTELNTVLRAAAACDVSVYASVTIGNSESLEQRVQMLAGVHALQQQTSALQSILVRVHHAATPEVRREEEATAVDYLKTLAVTRLFLENIEHVQADWSVMGPKVLELALRFGANDAGSVLWSQRNGPEPSHHGGESELRRIIRDAGFRPVQRDALFRQSLLH
jgi:cyclic dehypoxanthinyl futalosine synthase